MFYGGDQRGNPHTLVGPTDSSSISYEVTPPMRRFPKTSHSAAESHNLYVCGSGCWRLAEMVAQLLPQVRIRGAVLRMSVRPRDVSRGDWCGVLFARVLGPNGGKHDER